MSTRPNVYAAIDSEREYQDKKWGGARSSGTAGNGERTLDEFSSYIYGYATDLQYLASHELDPVKKLDFVRKVAGLCVACMEQHGAPPRV